MRNALTFSTIAFALMLSCSSAPIDLAGGSTSTPNEVVMGSAVLPTGAPAARTIVQLVPASFAAIGEADPSLLATDTTDETGAYRFFHVDTGMYNIEAVNIDTRTRALVTGINVDTDTVRASSAVLSPAGRIQIIVSPSFDPLSGYLFISGTTNAVVIDGIRDTLILDSVPEGTLSGVNYATAGESGSTVLRYNVPVLSGETVTISNPIWKFSRRLYLNTSMDAAAITETILNFPVCIRLTSKNFTFSQAQTNGADIRFSKSDNTPLAYEIERWDAANGKAEIWVKVDTVYGNDSMQNILMYWGNPDAPESSNGATVFDTSSGFGGVWHLGETPSGSASIMDQSDNHYNGTPLGDFTASSLVDGSIGKGLYFNGIDNIIPIGQGVKKGPVFTLEAWVFTTLNENQRFIHDPNGYSLWYDKQKSGLRMEFRDKTTTWHGIPQDGGTPQPLSMGTWCYVAGSFDGVKMRLYVNGALAATSDSITALASPPTSTDSLLIGGTWSGDHVQGVLDEIRMHYTQRSNDWIKLCYMNQRTDDKFVVFK